MTWLSTSTYVVIDSRCLEKDTESVLSRKEIDLSMLGIIVCVLIAEALVGPKAVANLRCSCEVELD